MNSSENFLEVPSLAKLASKAVCKMFDETSKKIRDEEESITSKKVAQSEKDEAAEIKRIRNKYKAEREAMWAACEERIAGREASFSSERNRATHEVAVAGIPTAKCGTCRRTKNTTKICSYDGCTSHQICSSFSPQEYVECLICHDILCQNHVLDHEEPCVKPHYRTCGFRARRDWGEGLWGSGPLFIPGHCRLSIADTLETLKCQGCSAACCQECLVRAGNDGKLQRDGEILLCKSCADVTRQRFPHWKEEAKLSDTAREHSPPFRTYTPYVSTRSKNDDDYFTVFLCLGFYGDILEENDRLLADACSRNLSIVSSVQFP